MLPAYGGEGGSRLTPCATRSFRPESNSQRPAAQRDLLRRADGRGVGILVLWTATFTLTGYFFGKIPGVRDHFWLGIVGIIAFSILTALAEARWAGRKGA